MKSRIMIAAQQLMMIASSVGCIIAIVFLSPQSPVRLWSIIALVVSTVWQIANTRCPHCGRFGSVNPKLTAKDAGVCIHCHELVEYK